MVISPRLVPYETHFRPSHLIEVPALSEFVDAMDGTIIVSGSGEEVFGSPNPPVSHLRGTVVDAFSSGGQITLVITLEQGES